MRLKLICKFSLTALSHSNLYRELNPGIWKVTKMQRIRKVYKLIKEAPLHFQLHWVDFNTLFSVYFWKHYLEFLLAFNLESETFNTEN